MKLSQRFLGFPSVTSRGICRYECAQARARGGRFKRLTNCRNRIFDTPGLQERESTVVMSVLDIRAKLQGSIKGDNRVRKISQQIGAETCRTVRPRGKWI